MNCDIIKNMPLTTDKGPTIENLLGNQFLPDDLKSQSISKTLDFSKPKIKSGLEDILEGDIKMPFGSEILLLQHEAIKAGPEVYAAFIKRHLNRGVNRDWEHKNISFD